MNWVVQNYLKHVGLEFGNYDLANLLKSFQIYMNVKTLKVTASVFAWKVHSLSKCLWHKVSLTYPETMGDYEDLFGR